MLIGKREKERVCPFFSVYITEHTPINSVYKNNSKHVFIYRLFDTYFSHCTQMA